MATNSPGSSNGATVEGRKVSASDIQLVQNLIERCMQLYMPQKEVAQTLHSQTKIEPGFTNLVWQKLEEQNPEFFKAYYLRLKIKDQVVMFNYLLEQQVQMVQKLHMSWMALPGMFPRPGMPGMPPLGALPPGMQPGPFSNFNIPQQPAPAMPTGLQQQPQQQVQQQAPHMPLPLAPLDPHQLDAQLNVEGLNADLLGATLSEAELDGPGEINLMPGSPDDLIETLADLAGLQASGSADNLTLDQNHGQLPQLPKNFSFSDIMPQLGSDALDGVHDNGLTGLPDFGNGSFMGLPDMTGLGDMTLDLDSLDK